MLLVFTMVALAGCGGEVHLGGPSGAGGAAENQVGDSLSALVTSSKWCAETGEGTHLIYGLKFSPDQSARLVIATTLTAAAEPYGSHLKWEVENDTAYLSVAGTRLPNFTFKRGTAGKLRFESTIIVDASAQGKLDLTSCNPAQLQATGL